MGLLDKFFKPAARGPAPLPSGSFTVDSGGEILSSTVPSSFPRESLKTIGAQVVKAFENARGADVTLGELNISFDAMTLKAREMRGGAMIFLSPRGEARK